MANDVKLAEFVGLKVRKIQKQIGKLSILQKKRNNFFFFWPEE